MLPPSPALLERAQGILDNPISTQVTLLGALKFVCHQPTQWKAYAAKAFCDALKPASVCDSSGGWGDHLTGFMASDSVQKIFVIEPRATACEAFKRQKADTCGLPGAKKFISKKFDTRGAFARNHQFPVILGLQFPVGFPYSARGAFRVIHEYLIVGSSPCGSVTN
eukprot:COSAG02_NODE_6770_length_3370_cov_1.778967_2_plen_166_part_00